MKEFNAPGYLNNSNIYEVNIRQYTPEGTFEAFANHLPRLKEMGVDILWLMPIHPIGIPHRKGTLGSYYSISNHQAINPEFGTMADFDNLVSKIHGLGMKVILDWVANHAAWDHVWTIQHPQFFVRDEFGFKSPFDWTDVIQLDHQNAEQQEAMINAMKFWVEEKNVDGFRADLAHLTPLPFWLKARRVIDGIKQDTIWLAESEELSYAEVFDITFTWRWMHESQNVLSKAGGLEKLWKFLEEDDFPGLRLYFTSNHDENSWNGTEYEKYGVYARALAVFSALYKNSVPLIYSGQEVGNKKRLSFFEKDPVNWSDGEDLGQFYSTLLSLRKKPGIVFSEKDFRFIHFPELIVFLHKGEAGTILVLLHLGTREVSIQPFEIAGVDGKEVFNEERLDKNSPAIIMQPGDYRVYESFRSA
jgi:glycosidase